MTTSLRRCAALAAAVALAACRSGDSPQPERSSSVMPGEGFATVPGGRVWYRVAGTGPGIPLVVVHGGPGSSSHYLESLAQLGSDRPVVFYDQLGSGRSDRATDTTLWRMDRFMAELDSLRAHLKLTEIHLLGHSWGSMIATDYVLSGATGVRSVTLASPVLSVARWAADVDSLVAKMPRDLQRAIEQSEAVGSYTDSAYRKAVRYYADRYLTLRGGPPYDTLMSHRNPAIHAYMWGPGDFAVTGTLKTWDRTDRLGELRLPVLFTIGENDEVRRPTVDFYRSLTPGAHFELIPFSAHLTPLDSPEQFADAIRRFLTSVESDG